MLRPDEAPMTILRGWKEIAARLKVSIRTAQRYANRRRLPVTKEGSQRQSRVWADAQEIDEWLRAQQHRSAAAIIQRVGLHRLATGIVAVAVIVILSWPTSHAAEDWQTGWVAFTSFRDGNPEIYVIRDDGTDERRLTSHPGLDASPAISPDGQRIAFSSNRGGYADIWMMNRDGSGLRPLAIGQQGSRCRLNGIDWRPDGQRIAFSNRMDDILAIYELPTGGGAAERVSDLSKDAQYPRYDVDGLTLYATLGHPYDGRSNRIAAVRSRTGQPHRITPMLDTSWASQVFVEGDPRVIYSLRLTRAVSRVLLQQPDGQSLPLEFLDGLGAGTPTGPRGPGAPMLGGAFLVNINGNIYMASLGGALVRVTTNGGAEASWWVPENPKPLEAGVLPNGLIDTPPSTWSGCFEAPAETTLLTMEGYRFFLFFEHAGDRAHVHVTLAHVEDVMVRLGIVKIFLDDLTTTGAPGFGPSALSRIVEIVRQRKSLFDEAWQEMVVNHVAE